MLGECLQEHSMLNPNTEKKKLFIKMKSQLLPSQELTPQDTSFPFSLHTGY